MITAGRVDLLSSTSHPLLPFVTITSGEFCIVSSNENFSPGLGFKLLIRAIDLDICSWSKLVIFISSFISPFANRFKLSNKILNPGESNDFSSSWIFKHSDKSRAKTPAGSNFWSLTRTSSISLTSQSVSSAISSISVLIHPVGSR